MYKTTLYSAAILAACSLSNSAFAQTPHSMPMHENMQHNNSMPMPKQVMSHSAKVMTDAPQRPAFSEFPTPEELARMTPPEPITEEQIKQRFAKRRAHVEQMVARDRKHAEKYAKDFARYQKHQADELAKIMAKAEKQREGLLNRITQREQRVLENFRKRTEVRQAEPKHY